MLNIFKKNQKGELTQTTKPAKVLSIVKANDMIDELQQENARLKEGKATNYPEPTYNGKTIAEITSQAATKSLLAKAKKESDAKKQEQLVASIIKDPRLFHLGKNSSVEAIEAEMTYLAEQDAAKKKYEGTLAKQKAGKVAKEMWDNSTHTCNSPVYSVSKEGYSLCFDASNDGAFERVLIKTKAQNKWCELVKTGQPGSPNAVTNNPDAIPLNKAEFTSLLENQPTVEQLCSVYSFRVNQNVTISGEQIIPLW